MNLAPFSHSAGVDPAEHADSESSSHHAQATHGSSSRQDHGVAASSSRRAQNAQYRADEPNFEVAERPYNAHRGSTSTLGSTRRTSHYDNQRIGGRSPRPPSAGSQATVTTNRSRSKRRSNQYPGAYETLDETNMPPPVVAQEFPAFLEDARYHAPDPGSAPAANFSRPYQRGGTSASSARDQNWSEVSALPPVPRSQRSSQRFSAPSGAGNRRSQQIPEDPEREIASQRSEVEQPYSSRHPNELTGQPYMAAEWRTHLCTVSYLIFFSIFGTLARLGMQWLTFYPGAPLTTPVVWANMVGSMIMGFLSEDQVLFRDPAYRPIAGEKGRRAAAVNKAAAAKQKKTIPLYVGLATGFCGSFTSFSSFQRDIFLALSNNLPSPVYHSYTISTGIVSPSDTVGRNGGYSFEALVAVIFYTLALSLGGLFVGAHFALFASGITSPLPRNFIRKALDPLMVFLGWGCWLGALLLCIFPPDRPDGPSSRGSWSNGVWRGEVLFALVFAPVGCVLRYYASLKLNGLVPSFPLGTFAVNMFGTAVEGMCYDIQHVGVGYMGMVGGGRVGCQVLQGVQDGFCGCLTTVSTWVGEIQGLKRKHGYIYALGSIIGGLCLMVVIMGSVRWSVGFAAPACNTGYPSKLRG